MEEFLELFGNVTVGKVVLVICAGVFLWKCYSKVSGYFKEKSIRDYEQNKQIQEVMNCPKTIRYGDNRASISKRVSVTKWKRCSQK